MPVIGPFFTGAKELTIELKEPVIILRGDPQDTKITQILEGNVNLVLTRPIQVTKITLDFIGKSHSLWPDGIIIKGTKKYYHDKQIYKESLVLQSFRDNIKSEGILEAGVHQWPFQFILSNQLVETIEDEMAKVFYYLSAVVHRVGIVGASKLKTRRDILLLRIPNGSNDALEANSLPTTSIISERQLETCDVNICIEKSSVSSGMQFPISFTISPNIKRLFLESISVMLIEKKVYRLPEHQAKRAEFFDYRINLTSATSLVDPGFMQSNINPNFEMKGIRRVLHVKNAHVSLDDGPLQHRLLFTLPNCLQLNHTSTFSEISIRHSLRIRIDLTNENSNMHTNTHTIHFETPINILDCRLKEDFNSLPTYEQVSLNDTFLTEKDVNESTGFFACPCYLAYKKTCQGASVKDWLNIRYDTPPSYDSINYN